MRRIALALLVASIVLPAESTGQDTSVTVTARFVDFDDKPIKGVRLEALSIKGSPRAVSGDDGSVVLHVGWPPQRVDLPPSWTALPRLTSQLLLRAVGDGTTNHCFLRCVEKEKQLDLGKIQLNTGGTITGRVVDVKGNPVSGARVEACLPGPVSAENQVGGCPWYNVPPRGAPAFSDHDGRYRLEGVPDIFVAVVACTPGSLHGFSPTVGVFPGQTATAEDVVIRPAAPEQIIRGRVVGPDGEPVSDMHLAAEYDGGVLVESTTRSKKDGRFEMVVHAGKTYSICDLSSPPARDIKAGDHRVVVKLDAGRMRQLQESAVCYEWNCGCPEPDQRPCIVRGRVLLGGNAPAGWVGDLRNPSICTDWVPIRTNGRFALRVSEPGEWYLNLGFPRAPEGTRFGISSHVRLNAGENTWNLEIPVGEVQIENLKPLPTVKELANLPKWDDQTLREATRTLYELGWSGHGATGYAEKYAGPETIWTVSQVPVGNLEVNLVTRSVGGRPMGRHTLVRFTLKAGETKVVRLP